MDEFELLFMIPSCTKCNCSCNYLPFALKEQESPSVVGIFHVVLKNTEIGHKNTEIRLCAY